MYAPAGFELPAPLSSGTHPPPELQKYFKHQVYDRPDVFSKVDEHAIQVAGCDHPAFRDLMWDLVYRYKLDELERARVIFRWMSSKDMQNIRFESSPPNSPEEVLLSFKYNRGTFARIFEIMCSYSNIHCITVSGYAKGVDYLPGDRFSGLPSNHSWNVIYIRGSWQLVDAHWAARYLSSGRNIPENVVYEYDDFYFMMEPQQAVYSHFPEDSRWQLLPVPLTLTQFESLPLTKSQFFKCAIDFLEQHHGVVYTQDGRLRMTLGFWRPGGFTYKLQYLTTSAGHRHPETLPASPSDLSDKVPNLDVDLKGFLLQETTKDKLNYYFRLPAAGVYYLTIYAQELSNLTIGRESTFRAACEYKIVCDAPASDAQTYPTCHDANWGPAWPHVQHYALEPSHSEGVISVTAKRDLTTSTDGRTLPPATVDIHFGKQRPEVSLLAKLHRNGVPDDFLDQYQRVVETARKTQFHVTLPEPGEYGLEIYANEPAEGDTYTHMCQYLIHYEAPAGWRPTTPRLTASGSDAGPSPQAMQSWHPNDSTGDNASYQPGDASKWSASNVQPAGPLKDMYNYELHAPPMGQLPRPYADSQYAEANTPLKFGKSQFPNRYSPSYGRTPSPVNASNRTSLNYAPRTGLIATGTAQDRFVSPAAPKASMEAISDLTGSLSSVRLRQSSESILVNKNQIHRSRMSDLGKHTDDVPSVSHCSQSKGQLGTANKDCLLTVQPYMANVARGGSPVLLGRRDAQLQSDNRRVTFDPTLVGHLDESHTSDLPLPSPPPYVRLNSWSSSGEQKSHRDLPPPVPATTNANQTLPGGFGGSNRFGRQPGTVSSSQGPTGVSPYDRSNPNSQSYSHGQSTGLHGRSGSNGQSEAGYYNNGFYSQVSPPGSTISSVSTHRSPYSHQQQYDQISSTPGGPAGYVSSGPSYRPDQSTANWGAGPIQREPPKEFSLRPLATESYTEKPRPQELPSIGDKSAMPYGSFEMFRRVDEHAVNISQQQQDNFNQLIWQLIYARNITDELEKVRVIFLWLCTKDLHKMNFDNVKPDSPEEILMGIRTGKSTYAQIFHTLCRYAGLHCKLLIGYAKGAEYAPGMHFSGRQGQHSWNAVLIDKVWCLVDCHWAARRLIGKRPSPENVRYGLDMFYFLANPGQLIYTHFPHDADWQLLRHPISLKEFENLAPVKSAFFKYNLDLVTHRNAVIMCSDPEVCIAIAFPPQAEQYLSFTFGLSIDNKEGSEDYRGLPLNRYGRQEIVVREHKSLFYVRPPRPGAYKVLIYAKQQQTDSKSTGNGTLDNKNEVGSANMYGAVCEYRLVATFGPNCSLPPYPPCQSSSYGPNELAKNYQVQAMHTECTLRANRGCLELRFALGSSPGNPPPRLMGKLRCTLVPEEALTRSLLQRNVNRNREAVFAVFLPEAGEYGLEIYANNPSKDGNSFFVIWQYIILSDNESPVRGLPTIPPAYLGPSPRFESMGLSTVSHPDPFVQANTGELCIQLNRSAHTPVRIMAQLIHASHDVSEDCSQQVLQQMRENQVYFVIRFPHLGFFKFQIYALPYSEPGESLPSVFNYLLEVTQVHRNRSGQVMCFPQQFAQWKEGCYLHSPLDGILSPGQHTGDLVPFRVTVPTAQAVAVVVGDDWTHLTQMGDRWEGQVPLKSHWGHERQLAVCANFANTVDGNYGTLLEYVLSR